MNNSSTNTSNQPNTAKTRIPQGSFLTRYSMATYLKRKISKLSRRPSKFTNEEVYY